MPQLPAAVGARASEIVLGLQEVPLGEAAARAKGDEIAKRLSAFLLNPGALGPGHQDGL